MKTQSIETFAVLVGVVVAIAGLVVAAVRTAIAWHESDLRRGYLLRKFWKGDGIRHWLGHFSPRKKFKLYEAACLLAGTRSTWPPPTQVAENWYNAFVAAIENGKFGGHFADEDATNDPIDDLNWAKGQGDGAPSMVHKLEVDRVNLRKLVKAAGRRVPKWLRANRDASD